MITILLASIQTSTPGDCLLTGLCGLIPDDPPFAPGIMWVALGLVVFGLVGLRRAKQRS
ncbi:MAG: hypothetical protein ABIZ70_02730 [Gemmatimonadales bacterium]